jgi:tetratricopeptide (TPR) repeat protein
MSQSQQAALNLLCVTGVLLLCGFQLQSQTVSVIHASASETRPESVPDVSPEVRGDLLMARGKYAAAIDLYEQVQPRTAVTWNKLGVAYHHLFALDEAMKDYKMAVKLNPHYAGAYNNLGAVYHGKHEFSLAVKAYKRSLKYQPHAAVTYCNLATTYFAESKYKKGAEAYQEALKLDPDVLSADRRDQVEESSTREQRMVFAFYLAELYASIGRKDEALAALRKAFSNGFSDRKRLMEDKELAELRKTPEFQQLVTDAQLQ